MRITAGSLRGRRITVPDIPGVRPTPSKVRQALFNILGGIEGWRVLELFSGSGLMAVESLSRGAVAVTSIERNRRIVNALKEVSGTFSLEDRWHVLCGDVRSELGRLAGQHFDLVFADPPYDSGISEQLPLWLTAANIGCGQLVIEEAAHATPRWPEGWTERQMRRYGETCLHFLNAEGA